MWYPNYIVPVIRKILQVTPEFGVFRMRMNNLRRILESLLTSTLRRYLELTAPQHGEPKRSKISAALNEVDILQIMDFLGVHENIASAYSCQWLILHDNSRFMRKVNSSKCITKGCKLQKEMIMG